MTALFDEAGYKDFTLKITGFRAGSVITDYIIALRSLTSLTNEQIAAKVMAAKIRLINSGKFPVKGAFDAAKAGISVSAVKTTTTVTSVAQQKSALAATKAPSGNSVNSVNSVNSQNNHAEIGRSSAFFLLLTVGAIVNVV